MARKNHSRQDGAGSIHFDPRTKTVMAETRGEENIKEKVFAVREVVPGKSNNEIVLVLQYFDYDVEKSIQAYLEDGAKAALQEWNFTGSQQANKKRRNKKKAAVDKGGDSGVVADAKTDGTGATKSPVLTNHTDHDQQLVNGNGGRLPNGHLPNQDDVNSLSNGSSAKSSSSNNNNHNRGSKSADNHRPHPSQTSSSTSKSTNSHSSVPQPQRHAKGKGPRESHSVHHNAVKQHHLQQQRERTMSERSNASSAFGDPHHSLDKSFKDLQRQTTSLERLRHLLDTEIDRSYKSVKKVFEELRKGLDAREARLVSDMDVLKQEAYAMLDSRHSKAKELKRMAERGERLQDSEIAEVRSQIKHFVSDRRHDEEMGRTTRFLYDSDHLLKEVEKFGEVVPIIKIVPRESSSVSTSNGDHSPSDDFSPSSEVAEIEHRLKTTLGMQNPSQPSSPSNHHQPTSYDNRKGPRNNKNDSNIRQSGSGAKSSQSQTSMSTSSSPAPPQHSSPRPRTSDSNQVSNNDNNSNANVSSNQDGNRSNYRGGRGGRGHRGQGRGRGSGRGYRGSSFSARGGGHQQQSSQGHSGVAS